MFFALILSLALGANPGPPLVATAAAGIEHQPLSRTPRDSRVVVEARLENFSGLFSLLVFARRSPKAPYVAYTMRSLGHGRFRARLPQSILREGAFEYFIEARSEDQDLRRLGSPRDPFRTVAYDPPLTPIAVTVRTEPAGAAVKIDDQDAGRAPLTVQLLPGRHRIAAAVEDGRSVERQLEVKAGDEQAVTLELPRQAGALTTLSVVSDPPGASVLIDAALAGRTPFDGQLAAGPHEISVETMGRLPERRRVVAREGRDVALSFSLAALPRTSAVAVESEPRGALVLVDGKQRGRAPLVLALGKGPHQLLLKLEGRREVATDFIMPADRDLSLHLELPAATSGGSRLTVASTPRGGLLTLDGKQAGITPWSSEVAAGRHRLAVSADGFATEERVVAVQPNRDGDVAFTLTRLPGPASVHVDAEPPGALLTIDGVRAGETPLTRSLEPGEHLLEVSAEGYKTIQQSVQLDPGQQMSLKLALQRAEAEHEPPLIGVGSDPAGAILFLDGKAIGPTPAKVRSTAGHHELKLVLDGYLTRTGKFVIPAARDFELRVAISLKRIRGTEERHAGPTPAELSAAEIAAAHACSSTGDYACALKSYQKAYQYTPRARLLFNIASMRRKLAMYAEAARAYQAYLEHRDGEESLEREAEKQLRFCEQKLSTPDAAAVAAVEDDDNDPPLLAHDPVNKAVRGQPLRLTARIVDERSGVSNAQACWRNLYAKEFSCQPMQDIGGDRYGVEVPARSVIEGFAYYLEAYDNSDNGPARSGAPELPNAVAIDDAPPPVVAARVLEASAVKVSAPAPAVAPALAQSVPGKASSRLLRTGLLAGAMLVSAATAFALHTSAENLIAQANDRGSTSSAADRAAQLDRATTRQTVATAFLGAAVALAAGAAVSWAF